MLLTAKYDSTTVKYKKVHSEEQIPSIVHPEKKHTYVSDKIVGYTPLMHHYTFGRIGDDVCGGIYIRAGAEIPEHITLEVAKQEITVKLDGLTLELVIPKPKNP